MRRVPLRTPSVLAVLAPERSARIRTRHIFKEISRIFSDDITKAHAHDSATALASLAATPIVQSESRSAELIERERHRALRRPHPHPTRSDTSLPRPKARLLLSAEAATRRCFGRSTTTEESSTYGPQGINSNGRLPAPQSGKPQATTNERGCRAHAMRVAHARGCDSATFVVRASHARACTHSKGKGMLCASRRLCIERVRRVPRGTRKRVVS